MRTPIAVTLHGRVVTQTDRAVLFHASVGQLTGTPAEAAGQRFWLPLRWVGHWRREGGRDILAVRRTRLLGKLRTTTQAPQRTPWWIDTD